VLSDWLISVQSLAGATTRVGYGKRCRSVSRHFGTGAGVLDTSAPVPKCLQTLRHWCRCVLGPKCLVTLQTGNTDVQDATRLRTLVSLRCVQVSACGQSPSPLVWPHDVSYRGPELVWATGRLMSPDRGFGTSCLLHCGHLTVSTNSEDS